MGSNSNNSNWWNMEQSFFSLNSPERNRPGEVGALGNDRLSESLTDLSQYMETGGGGGGAGGNGQNPANPDNIESFMQPSNPSTSKSLTVPIRNTSTINGIPIPLTNQLSSNTIGSETEQSQMSEEILAALKSSKNILLECPPGLNRQLQILRILLDYWNWRKSEDETENRPLSSKRVKNEKCDQEEKENSPNPSKIIFCCNNTSDNSMISNFREKVSNLEAWLNNITVVVLNGAHQLECVFRDGIESMEELLSFDLVQECGLLICPQEVVISLPNRANIGISQINGAIIVFDDGYNLEETSKNELSVEIFPDELNTFLEIMNLLQTENFEGNEVIALRNRLMEAIPNLASWIQIQKEGNTSEDILEQIKNLQISEFMQTSFEQMSRKLFEHTRSNREHDHSEFEAVKKFQKFLLILPLLYEDDINFRLVISNYPNPDNPRPRRTGNALKITCANPSLLMKPIGDAAMSVIVSGSCLTPYSSWDEDLSPGSGVGIKFQDPIKVYDGNQLSREKFIFTSTTVGPSDTLLNMKHTPRSTPAVQAEVFAGLKRICDTVPSRSPVVILFHSDSFLQSLMEKKNRKLNENDPDSEASAEKINLATYLTRNRQRRVFCELYMGHDESPEDFIRKINFGQSEQIVLLVLHRGRIFPDNSNLLSGNKIRTIVHTSVPYGAREHLDRFIAKDGYYDKLLRNQEQGQGQDEGQVEVESQGQSQGSYIDGKSFHRREAFRVLSQSFGFIQAQIQADFLQAGGKQKSNGKDWGLVIVMDCRLSKKQGDFPDFIPHWVQQCRSCHFDKENGGFDEMIGLITGLNLL